MLLQYTNKGNRYILVIADYFTKWTEAYALPNHTAVTVAETLITEFVCRWGMPLAIHSDQGREFESRLFKEMCRLLGGDKTKTCPYHPQSDGMVERFNRTCISMLSAFVNEHKDDWDEYLPYLLAAYRASIHDSTGFTPNRLMTGRECDLPIDLLYKDARASDIPPEKYGPYVTWVREAIEKAYDFCS